MVDVLVGAGYKKGTVKTPSGESVSKSIENSVLLAVLPVTRYSILARLKSELNNSSMTTIDTN